MPGLNIGLTDLLFLQQVLACRKRQACLFRHRGLRPVAAHELCTVGAQSHVYRPRSVFWHAHVAPENLSHFISPLRRRNSTRFFDTLGPAVFAAGLAFWTNVRPGRTVGEVMFFWDGKKKKMTKSAKRAFFLMKSCYNCSLRAFV